MTDTTQYLLCCIQQDPSKDSKTKSRKPSINDRWRTQQDLRRRTMSDRTGLEGFVKRFKSYRLNENRSDLSPISILKIVWIDNQVRAVIITWLNQWGLAGHWRTIVGICYQLLDDDHNGNVLLWAFEVILMNFLAQLSIVLFSVCQHSPEDFDELLTIKKPNWMALHLLIESNVLTNKSKQNAKSANY